jgi:hypothetical protein
MTPTNIARFSILVVIMMVTLVGCATTKKTAERPVDANSITVERHYITVPRPEGPPKYDPLIAGEHVGSSNNIQIFRSNFLRAVRYSEILEGVVDAYEAQAKPIENTN